MQRNEILEAGAILYFRRKDTFRTFKFTLIRRLPYQNPSHTGELWKCYDENGKIRSQLFYKCENIDKILE